MNRAQSLYSTSRRKIEISAAKESSQLGEYTITSKATANWPIP